MGVFYGSAAAAAGGAGQRPGEESALKRQRTGAPGLHFKALQFSWTSLALAGVDNHGKVTARARPCGIPSKVKTQYFAERRQSDVILHFVGRKVVRNRGSSARR